MDFVDITSISELGDAPDGFRYLDFLGGEKEIRCFLVPESMPRSCFLEDYSHLLDPCLEPVYNNKGICVRQDASYALPGFYILGLKTHYKSIDDLDELTQLRTSLIIRDIRKGMRESLDIPYIHMYYEEKPALSCHVHYWLLPFPTDEEKKKYSIYNMDVKKHLEQFKFSENKEKILNNNARLRSYLDNSQLYERDNHFISSYYHSMALI